MADYAIWRDNLGSGMSLPNDNTAGVGQDDYVRWRTNFGAIPPGSASGASVPEPASGALFVAMMAAMVLGQGSRPH